MLVEKIRNLLNGKNNRAANIQGNDNQIVKGSDAQIVEGDGVNIGNMESKNETSPMFSKCQFAQRIDKMDIH